MLKKAEKVELVNKLSEELKSQESWYFIGFAGLKFVEFNELRSLLREKGSRVRVIKTRLLAKALEKIGRKLPAEILQKPVALVTVEEYLSAAKTLQTFAKDHPNLIIYGGYVEGEQVDQAKVAVFGALPTREELYGKLVGSVHSPLYRIVNALRWNGFALTSVLKQQLQKLI